MATTIHYSTLVDTSAGGAYSYSVDVGTPAPKVIMLFTGWADNANYMPVAPTFGGQSMTIRIAPNNSVGGHRNVYGYLLTPSPALSGSQTLAFNRNATDSTGSSRTILVWVKSTDTPVENSLTSGAAASISHNPTIDTSPDLTLAFGGHTSSDTGTTADANMTSMGSATTGGIKVEFAYETVESDGSRDIGFNGNGIHAGGHIVLENFTSDILLTPDPVALQVTVPAPTITGAGDIVAYHNPVALKVVVPEPAVTVSYPRVLPTVGVHVKTPGRVESATGLTAPRLSEVAGVPTWVENSNVYQDNLVATTDPTVNDDVDLGYSVGSLWLNTTDGLLWKCIDATDGAAVWIITGYDGHMLQPQTNDHGDHWIQLGDGQDATNPTFLEIGGTTNDATWGSWGGAFAVRKVDSDEAIWLHARADGFIIYQWDSVTDTAAADGSVTLELGERGSAPATPDSTNWKLYFKSDGFYVMDDAGVETGPMGSGGGSALTVTDESGTVSDTAVTSITVPDGTLVDNGTGDVTLREVPAGVIGCRLTNSAVQALSATTLTDLVFNTAEFDSDGFWSGSGGDIVIPAGLGGQYMLSGYIYTSTGYTLLGRWEVNGSAVHGNQPTLARSGGIGHMVTAGPVTLAAGDTVNLVGWLSTGGNLGDATNAEQRCAAGIYKLGSGTVGEAIGASVYNSGVQSVGTSATALTFDSEEWDTDSLHDTGSNTERLTVPAGMGGKWLVTAQTHSFPASANLRVFMGIAVNGTVVHQWENDDTNDAYIAIPGTFVLDLSAGDYVSFVVKTQAGSATNFGHASAFTNQSKLQMTLLATQGANSNEPRDCTAFPTGAATGTRRRRTDLDYMVFFYDGTRWLSEQLFETQFSSYGFTINTDSTGWHFPLPTDFAIWLVDWRQQLYSNSAAAVYSFILRSCLADNSSYPTLKTVSRSVTGADTWNSFQEDIGVAVDGTGGNTGTNPVALQIYFDETTNGSTEIVSAVLRYRLIAT